MAGAYLEKSAFDEFAQAIKRVGVPSRLVTPVVQALARRTPPDAALRTLAEHEARLDPLTAAVLYAALGEKDRALALLERAYKEPNADITVLLSPLPIFDELRSDARYRAMLQGLRVGSPATAEP